MKKIISLLLSATIFLTTAAITFANEPSDSNYEEIAPDEQVSFVVSMEGDAVLAAKEAVTLGIDYMDTRRAKQAENNIINQQAQVLSDIENASESDVELLYTYTTLFNGFSVSAPYKMMDDIKKLPGVKDVYISQEMETHLLSATEQSHSNPIQTSDATQKSGYTGKGQAVAIIDNEFLVNHEMFDCTVPDPKITREDANSVKANAYVNDKIPFAYDYGENDTDTKSTSLSHGTHVASIAAGTHINSLSKFESGNAELPETFSGVAPDSQLVLMKVSDSNGKMYDNAILAALNDVAKLKVCAVNLSLGNAYSSSQIYGSLKTSINNAKDVGIFVSISAGNEGIGYNESNISTEIPDYSASGTPASHTNATAVASVQNAHIVYMVTTMTTQDGTQIEYIPSFSSCTFTKDFVGQTLEYVDCGTGLTADFSEKNVEGKLALIKRGTISYNQSANNAYSAGAIGVVFYNENNASVQTESLSFPAVYIRYQDAQKMIASEQKTVTINNQQNLYSKATNGGLISGYSSWGVDETLELKPEISAPGGYILAAVTHSTNTDRYAYMSGTSMAAPHITGTVALLSEYLELKGITAVGADRVNLIENLLMSTADIVKQRSTDVPYSPRVQGAGLVNTAAAMNTPAILIGDNNKTKLSLGEIGNTISLTFTLKNISSQSVSYENIEADVITDDYTNTNGENVFKGVSRRLSANAKIYEGTSQTEISSITVSPNSSVTLRAEIELDEAELSSNLTIFKNGFFVDGFVRLSNTLNPEISIPFTSFYGDWSSASVFDKTMYENGNSRLLGKWHRTFNGTYAISKNIFSTNSVVINQGKCADGTWNQDRIAISPNGDGMSDYIGMSVNLMRTAKDLRMELINNATGKKAFTQYFGGNLNKYQQQQLFMPNLAKLSQSALPDGTYTLKLFGSLLYDGAIEHSVSLPVTVDREKPIIKNISLNESTLSVTATDTNYIKLIKVNFIDNTGALRTLTFDKDKEKGADVTQTISSSLLIKSFISVEVTDDAYNTTSVSLSNVSDLFAGYLQSHSTLDGMTSTSISILNKLSSDVTADIVLAYYDADGKLIATKNNPDTLLTGGANTIVSSKSFDDTAGAKQIRMFMWDDANTLKPIDIQRVFTVN